MANPKAADVKKGISVLWETLQCPICLDLLTTPVSTKCDHQFCKFCLMKLLDNSKQNRANCPVCKANITKRSLQESPGFQRLVAGLQDMIQAYENDTGTSYFTGLARQVNHSTGMDAETTEDARDASSRDTRDTDLSSEKNTHQDNLAQSNTSTTAAENEFARLMGYNDFSLENEGLDSGLGDAPPTFDKKIDSVSKDLELLCSVPGVKEETLNHTTRNKGSLVKWPSSSPIPDAPEHRLSRKSTRKKHKKEPDKVLEQRKKKSLEKVAEWLMKVPAEGDLKLDEADNNGDDSDSCSSTSTIDVWQQDIVNNLKREDRGKALEEQVFGAIYKRKPTRTSSPPDTFAKLPSTTETQDHEQEGADSVQHDDGTQEEQETVKQSSSGFFKEVKLLENNDTATHVNKSNHLPKSGPNKSKREFACPVSEETTRKRTRRTLQLDSDLKEQTPVGCEAPESQKPDKGKGRNGRSEKSKPARAPKPLVLVEAQNGEDSPKTRARSEVVQVQIESFSSSEDQDVPLLRRTRRSRRLQVFAEEVQMTKKKCKRVFVKKCGDTKEPENVEGETLEDTRWPENETVTGAVQRNGCVFDQDIGEIENFSCQKPTEANKESVAEMPNVKTQAEVSPACSLSVVPNTASYADVVDPTLESNKPDNASPTSTRLETSICEDECAGAEDEEENNDTEQLLKSFKATKRKSFYLGGPNVKKNNKETKTNHPDCVETESGKSHTANQEVSRETEESAFSDLISPSTSPVQTKKAVFERRNQAAVDAMIPDSSGSGRDRNSPSSVLTPNQVARSAAECTNLSGVPQVVDSGLRFTVVEHEEINKSSIKDAGSVQQMEDGVLLDGSSAQNCSVKTPERTVITKSSLTPDGLIIPDVQIVHSPKTSSHGSGEISSLSSTKGKGKEQKKMKRKVQKLDSSDSSDSEEDLPSLTQIFGTSARRRAARTQDRVDESAREELAGEADGGQGGCLPEEAQEELHRPPPACSSPDRVSPSQGSVDLFGTPEECEVPANNMEVSMESSQFSSEVLVTQQKIEMQKELERLTKLMALVSEVLHEKEENPSKQIPPEAHRSDEAAEPQEYKVCDQETDRRSDRRNAPDVPDPHPGSSDVNKDAESARSTRDGIAEKVPDATCTKLSVETPNMPTSASTAKAPKNSDSPSDKQEDKENNSPPKDGPKAKLVLVSSGLAPSEQILVKKFARRVGARVAKQVTSEVTHVIMHTDEQLVCERTLKYFLGIAGRKWVVSFQWISECFKQKKVLDESPFEVRGDVVNGPDHQGPSRARVTQDSNLLMKGFDICFQGPFTDMTTDEMEWMVELCGAAVARDPLLFNGKQTSHQLVVVQPKSESSSSSTFTDLSRHATVVSRSWLLDSVATYSLQNYSNYVP